MVLGVHCLRIVVRSQVSAEDELCAVYECLNSLVCSSVRKSFANIFVGALCVMMVVAMCSASGVCIVVPKVQNMCVVCVQCSVPA